jgi:hypothetical protein
LCTLTKKQAYKKFILGAVLFASLVSCHPDRFYTWFTIKNNSSKVICYTYSNLYPDTSIPKGNYLPSGAAGVPSVTIQPGEGYDLIKSATLESYFTSVASDTIALFIFDASIVQTVPWILCSLNT